MDQDDRRSFGLLFEIENLIATCYGEYSLASTLVEKNSLKTRFSRHFRRTRLPLGQSLIAKACGSASENLAILEAHLSAIGESDARSPLDVRSGIYAIFECLSKEKRLQQKHFSPQEQLIFVCAFFLENLTSSIAQSASICTVDPLFHRVLSGLLTSQKGRAAVVRTALLSRNELWKTFASSRLFQQSFDESDLSGMQGPPSTKPCLDFIIKKSAAFLSGDESGAPGKFFPAGIKSLAMGNTAFFASEKIRYSFLLQSDQEIEEKFVRHPEIVKLKPMTFFKENEEIVENVESQPWDQNEFASYSPRALQISNAIVHGAVGIVCCSGRVVEESLWHTDPARHRYEIDHGGVRLFAKEVEELKGSTAAILTGSAESYWHTLVDSVARLAIIPRTCWPSIDRLLYPSTGVKVNELLDLYDLPKSLEKRIVYPHETLRLQHFTYPSSIHGLFDYHPGIMREVFTSIADRAGSSNVDTHNKLLYIERGASAYRPLFNEGEVIACLADFRPVRLESLTILEQVRLFSNASIIVAPHGAGLANIVFASSRCAVIEIMMDRYCNWCYRRIASIMKQDYFCVLGRAESINTKVHSTGWTVDVREVRETVDLAVKAIRKSGLQS